MATSSDRKKSRKRLPADARLRIEQARQVARQDMALGLMSLFRPIALAHRGLDSSGKRKREYLELEQTWKGVKVIVAGPEMSQAEQGVLLALLSLSLQQQDGGIATLEGPPIGMIPADKRESGNEGSRYPVVAVRTTVGRLCSVLGVPADGNSRRSVLTAIRRLAGVTLTVMGGGRWATTHLIHNAAGDDGSDSLAIVLNWRLTTALAGQGYASIPMKDYREVPPGVPRLIYAWLCSWLAARGGERRISLAALEPHIYGDIAVDRRAASRRRQALRRGLVALREIGWHIEIDDSGMATIDRRSTDALATCTSSRQTPDKLATAVRRNQALARVSD